MGRRDMSDCWRNHHRFCHEIREQLVEVPRSGDIYLLVCDLLCRDGKSRFDFFAPFRLICRGRGSVCLLYKSKRYRLRAIFAAKMMNRERDASQDKISKSTVWRSSKPGPI